MQSRQLFIRAVEELITAADQIEFDPDNAHLYDQLIMSHWAGIQEKAIKAGLFTKSDNQETLFNQLKKNLENPENSAVKELYRRFVTNNVVDGFENDNRLVLNEDWYRPVNTLQFWLVMQNLVSYYRGINPDFPTFDLLIMDAVDPNSRGEDRYPSHSGFIANLFSAIRMYHASFQLGLSQPSITYDKLDVEKSNLEDQQEITHFDEDQQEIDLNLTPDDKKKLRQVMKEIQHQTYILYECLLEDFLKKFQAIQKSCAANGKKTGGKYELQRKLMVEFNNVFGKDVKIIKKSVPSLRLHHLSVMDYADQFQQVINAAEKTLTKNQLNLLFSDDLLNQYRAIQNLNAIIPSKKPAKRGINNDIGINDFDTTTFPEKLKKLKKFADQFDNYEKNGVFRRDKRALKYAKAIAHILASIFSLGIYAGARAIHSKVFTTRSFQFWKSKEKLLAEKLKKGKKIINKSRPKP